MIGTKSWLLVRSDASLVVVLGYFAMMHQPMLMMVNADA
jgi:hypothetical protein